VLCWLQNPLRNWSVTKAYIILTKEINLIIVKEKTMTKKKVVCVFVVFVGLLILGAPTVIAAQYLGETTWTMTITQDQNGPVIPPKAGT
jgi:hypothetical protein